MSFRIFIIQFVFICLNWTKMYSFHSFYWIESREKCAAFGCCFCCRVSIEDWQCDTLSASLAFVRNHVRSDALSVPWIALFVKSPGTFHMNETAARRCSVSPLFPRTNRQTLSRNLMSRNTETISRMLLFFREINCNFPVESHYLPVSND